MAAVIRINPALPLSARRTAASGALVAILISASCGGGRAPAVAVTRAWEVMGTVFTVGAWGSDSVLLGAAVERAHDSLRLVDSLLSIDHEDSEITRVNRMGGTGGLPASDALRAVLGDALRVARLSRGAFDPTRRNWRALDYDSTSGVIRLEPGTRLDFGSIAKGYALDRAALALGGAADSAVLGLGGQLLLLGTELDDRRAVGRSVGITDPDHPLELLAVLDVPARPVSVSTSSQVEQPRPVVDPATDASASRTRSVTAVAQSAMAAGAWSTAGFAMGCDDGLALAEQAGVGLLCADERVRWTRDLDGRVALATAPLAGLGP